MKKAAANNPMNLSPEQIAAFRRDIRAFYRKYKRHLSFRESRDPYAILVAEVMLQQTQVERVLPKYEAFLQHFPDWASLARAHRRDLLAAWSGLGYNRRAIHLQELARIVMNEYGGELPREPDNLRKLPGIGPYTANAVAAFAFGKRVAAVDTNVRKVLIHKLGIPESTSAADIQHTAELVLPRSHIREWHCALMDYARLGMTSRANRSIPPRSKQSKFEGSIRQLRGELIRRLTTRHQVTLSAVARDTGRSLDDVRLAAEALAKDGLVVAGQKTVRLK